MIRSGAIILDAGGSCVQSILGKKILVNYLEFYEIILDISSRRYHQL